MDLSKAIDLFLGHYEKAGTREAYIYPLRHLSEYIGPARPISEITQLDLERWNNALNRSHYATATRNKYRRSIKSFFNYLVRLGQIPQSPATAITVKRRRQAVEKDRAMPDAALNRLLDFVQWKPRKRDHALILFLADSGCRIGEATTLTLDRLDLEQRRAWIDGKTGGRFVPFGEECSRILKLWLIQKGGGDYVFSEGAAPLTNLDQVFRRACMKAGIGSWGPHSLRHRKGWQFSDGNLSAKLAQETLGHYSIETTLNSYYPRDWKRIAEAADKLSVPAQEDETNILKPQFRKSQ